MTAFRLMIIFRYSSEIRFSLFHKSVMQSLKKCHLSAQKSRHVFVYRKGKSKSQIHQLIAAVIFHQVTVVLFHHFRLQCSFLSVDQLPVILVDK